jgi:hypothetical protein
MSVHPRGCVCALCETINGTTYRATPEYLTKREQFAAMALQGMLACPDNSGNPEAYAKDAVKQADALIAALSENAQHGS